MTTRVIGGHRCVMVGGKAVDIEKLRLLCTFVLSLLIVGGGGVMVVIDGNVKAEVFLIIGTVVGFWFGKAVAQGGRNGAG